jgi:hypothetical protein
MTIDLVPRGSACNAQEKHRRHRVCEVFGDVSRNMKSPFFQCHDPIFTPSGLVLFAAQLSAGLSRRQRLCPSDHFSDENPFFVKPRQREEGGFPLKSWASIQAITSGIRYELRLQPVETLRFAAQGVPKNYTRNSDFSGLVRRFQKK